MLEQSSSFRLASFPSAAPSRAVPSLLSTAGKRSVDGSTCSPAVPCSSFLRCLRTGSCGSVPSFLSAYEALLNGCVWLLAHDVVSLRDVAGLSVGSEILSWAYTCISTHLSRPKEARETRQEDRANSGATTGVTKDEDRKRGKTDDGVDDGESAGQVGNRGESALTTFAAVWWLSGLLVVNGVGTPTETRILTRVRSSIFLASLQIQDFILAAADLFPGSDEIGSEAPPGDARHQGSKHKKRVLPFGSRPGPAQAGSFLGAPADDVLEEKKTQQESAALQSCDNPTEEALGADRTSRVLSECGLRVRFQLEDVLDVLLSAILAPKQHLGLAGEGEQRKRLLTSSANLFTALSTKASPSGPVERGKSHLGQSCRAQGVYPREAQEGTRLALALTLRRAVERWIGFFSEFDLATAVPRERPSDRVQEGWPRHTYTQAKQVRPSSSLAGSGTEEEAHLPTGQPDACQGPEEVSDDRLSGGAGKGVLVAGSRARSARGQRSRRPSSRSVSGNPFLKLCARLAHPRHGTGCSACQDSPKTASLAEVVSALHSWMNGLEVLEDRGVYIYGSCVGSRCLPQPGGERLFTPTQCFPPEEGAVASFFTFFLNPNRTPTSSASPSSALSSCAQEPACSCQWDALRLASATLRLLDTNVLLLFSLNPPGFDVSSFWTPAEVSICRDSLRFAALRLFLLLLSSPPLASTSSFSTDLECKRRKGCCDPCRLLEAEEEKQDGSWHQGEEHPHKDLRLQQPSKKEAPVEHFGVSCSNQGAAEATLRKSYPSLFFVGYLLFKCLASLSLSSCFRILLPPSDGDVSSGKETSAGHSWNVASSSRVSARLVELLGQHAAATFAVCWRSLQSSGGRPVPPGESEELLRKKAGRQQSTEWHCYSPALARGFMRTLCDMVANYSVRRTGVTSLVAAASPHTTRTDQETEARHGERYEKAGGGSQMENNARSGAEEMEWTLVRALVQGLECLKIQLAGAAAAAPTIDRSDGDSEEEPEPSTGEQRIQRSTSKRRERACESATTSSTRGGTPSAANSGFSVSPYSTTSSSPSCDFLRPPVLLFQLAGKLLRRLSYWPRFLYYLCRSEDALQAIVILASEAAMSNPPLPSRVKISFLSDAGRVLLCMQAQQYLYVEFLPGDRIFSTAKEPKRKSAAPSGQKTVQVKQLTEEKSALDLGLGDRQTVGRTEVGKGGDEDITQPHPVPRADRQNVGVFERVDKAVRSYVELIDIVVAAHFPLSSRDFEDAAAALASQSSAATLGALAGLSGGKAKTGAFAPPLKKSPADDAGDIPEVALAAAVADYRAYRCLFFALVNTILQTLSFVQCFVSSTTQDPPQTDDTSRSDDDDDDVSDLFVQRYGSAKLGWLQLFQRLHSSIGEPRHLFQPVLFGFLSQVVRLAADAPEPLQLLLISQCSSPFFCRPCEDFTRWQAVRRKSATDETAPEEVQRGLRKQEPVQMDDRTGFVGGSDNATGGVPRDEGDWCLKVRLMERVVLPLLSRQRKNRRVLEILWISWWPQLLALLQLRGIDDALISLTASGPGAVTARPPTAFTASGPLERLFRDAVEKASLTRGKRQKGDIEKSAALLVASWCVERASVALGVIEVLLCVTPADQLRSQIAPCLFPSFEHPLGGGAISRRKACGRHPDSSGTASVAATALSRTIVTAANTATMFLSPFPLPPSSPWTDLVSSAASAENSEDLKSTARQADSWSLVDWLPSPVTLVGRLRMRGFGCLSAVICGTQTNSRLFASLLFNAALWPLLLRPTDFCNVQAKNLSRTLKLQQVGRQGSSPRAASPSGIRRTMYSLAVEGGEGLQDSAAAADKWRAGREESESLEEKAFQEFPVAPGDQVSCGVQEGDLAGEDESAESSSRRESYGFPSSPGGWTAQTAATLAAAAGTLAESRLSFPTADFLQGTDLAGQRAFATSSRGSSAGGWAGSTARVSSKPAGAGPSNVFLQLSQRRALARVSNSLSAVFSLLHPRQEEKEVTKAAGSRSDSSVVRERHFQAGAWSRHEEPETTLGSLSMMLPALSLVARDYTSRKGGAAAAAPAMRRGAPMEFERSKAGSRSEEDLRDEAIRQVMLGSRAWIVPGASGVHESTVKTQKVNERRCFSWATRRSAERPSGVNSVLLCSRRLG